MRVAPTPALVEASLPTRHGEFRVIAFPPDGASREPIALVKGDVSGRDGVPLRLHSEFLTGDVLGSRRCDCRAQLEGALAMIEKEGAGILLYLRQEGRGIGLYNKIRAYALQEQGFDTVEANRELGFADDQRTWREGADLIRLLGPRSIRLITNNPGKVDGLRREGIVVSGRIPMIVEPDEFNAGYLETKARRFGHLLGPSKRRGAAR